MPTREQWEAKLHESLISQEQYDQLTEEQKEESFGSTLAFGTAGIRGKIGLGPNRLNRFTVQKVALGLAQYLNEVTEQAKAVIAYDTRHFSKEFCDEIAVVLASNGITTYIYDRYHTPPELSYSVRYLQADAGVMITASHNPPEYNGIKIYGSDGGQMALEGSQKVSSYIDNIEDELNIAVKPLDQLKADGWVQEAHADIIESYKQQVIDLIQDIPSSDLKVVFSSLHGTSVPIIPELLAKSEDADLLIATDPDADRMGVVAKVGQDFHYFNGNQLGSLLLLYRIEQTAGIDNRAAVKSIVTSELGKVIAEQNHVKMFDVLTGFKFIAEKIAEFEANNDYHYIFGYEESYGYMASPFVRDKDAVQIVPLIIKLASELKNQGQTIVDKMNDIYDTYGHYQEKLFAHTFEGQSGKQKIEGIMDRARRDTPTELAGLEIIAVEDYLSQVRKDKNGESPINLPKADVLKFYFKDGWIALRPSGTEPKIKLYVSLVADNMEETAEKINAEFFN